MSNETEITIIAPRNFEEAKSMSTTLAKASLLPQALRGKEADVLMTVMAGAELGLGPIISIRSIHVIDGKPTLSSDLIAALCLRRSDVCEYLQPTESSATKATYTAKRKGSPAPVTMSFTIEEAKTAGLAGKGNWLKYPAAMLRARCISAICRAVFPDLVGGLYDSDSAEIEAPRDVTPRPTPPNVVDSTVTVDYGSDGAPVSERAKLEVAIAEAQDVTALTALVERITRLGAADKARVRVQWGARRDELMPKPVPGTRAGEVALAAPVAAPVQTEAVPS
jgi:RecT family